MSSFVNLSTYRFTPLRNLREMREHLLAACNRLNLKGTILLSPEGINLFIAGTKSSADSLLETLRMTPGLEDLTAKESWSDHQPFKRMLVRLKKEIIAFGVDSVRPAEYTSPKIAPKDLKKWLDEGRPVTLLDTRNDYEVKLGTFHGALDPDIKTFRAFPEAVRKLPEKLKEQPIVMFCTGGIRCEKAGPFMEEQGFREIYQLDGGILKYFEECGGEHFDGDCFVFDHRVGVDPTLGETDHAICFACQTPLDQRDQDDPRYVPGTSCPYCHVGNEGVMADKIEEIETKLESVVDPLPGSTPREFQRPVTIPARLDRSTLLESLCHLFPQVSADEWVKRLQDGRFRNYRGEVQGGDQIVRAGQRYLQSFPPAVEPDVATDIRVLHVDDSIIAVNKPAPLPMHSGGRYHRNTLHNLLSAACEPEIVRIVHRLDANTSGVVVFAKTRHVARLLGRQFEEGNVTKTYLARVLGRPNRDTFSLCAPITARPNRAGGREIGGDDDQPAETAFALLESDRQTSLLEARPVTGRTHQIRLHAAHAGHPIVGDPRYGKDASPDSPATLGPADPPMMLHAWKLRLEHPITGKELNFEATPPSWAGGVLS